MVAAARGPQLPLQRGRTSEPPALGTTWNPGKAHHPEIRQMPAANRKIRHRLRNPLRRRYPYQAAQLQRGKPEALF
ncbi:MAG: hypothetical protein DMG12_08355 [Acidobacteria bacterium]|nr:MAG: hypothetical protein DMG12_08355 [Acidobacteriota bacterium]